MDRTAFSLWVAAGALAVGLVSTGACSPTQRDFVGTAAGAGGSQSTGTQASAGGSPSAGGHSSAGGSPSAGGHPSAGGSPSAGGHSSAGGNPGPGGQGMGGQSQGGQGGGPGPCKSPDECPPPVADCLVADCVGGVCGTADAPKGTASRNPAGMGTCMANVCDGHGMTEMIIDPTNAPPTEGCLLGICNGGMPSTVVAPMGMTCTLSNGTGGTCDMNGNCSACMLGTTCGGPSGDCPRCMLGQGCQMGADCQSASCCGSTCVDSTSDQNNCGKCGNRCVGPCSAGVCQPLALAMNENGPSAIAVDGASVYWTDYLGGTVTRVPIGGGGQKVLATGQNGPVAIAVDPFNVYWANTGDGGILETAKDGSGNQALLASVGNPGGLALVGNTLYFTGGGAVQQTNVFPGNGVITLITGQQQPQGIATDANNVYWTENTPSGDVQQLALAVADGGAPAISLGQGNNFPYGIASDTVNVYWTNLGDGTVWQQRIGGGNQVQLASGQASPEAIVSDGAYVYWGSTNGLVQRVPVGGGAATVVANGQGEVTGIALDSSYVYWINGGPGGSVMQLEKP